VFRFRDFICLFSTCCIWTSCQRVNASVTYIRRDPLVAGIFTGDRCKPRYVNNLVSWCLRLVSSRRPIWKSLTTTKTTLISIFQHSLVLPSPYLCSYPDPGVPSGAENPHLGCSGQFGVTERSVFDLKALLRVKFLVKALNLNNA
jgi:hypothetical protein